MKRQVLSWSATVAAACALLALPWPALALEFKSIGNDPAVLYDAPTSRGRKLSVAPRGMPVEIVVVQGDWVRVRDATGELSWVERKSLTDKRTVVARALATVRVAADEGSGAVLRVQPGVLLDLLEAPTAGWAHVRHRDGASGWVKLSEVWGN